MPPKKAMPTPMFPPAEHDDPRVVFNDPTNFNGTVQALETIAYNKIVVYDTDKPGSTRKINTLELSKVVKKLQDAKRLRPTNRVNPVTKARERIAIGLNSPSGGGGPPAPPQPEPPKPAPTSGTRTQKLALV